MLALTLALLVGCSDTDGDGFRGSEDCDETQAGVHVGAEEVCDGLDNDCDGLVDNGATDAATYFFDGDQDGFGSEAITQQACEAPLGFSAVGGDCDDLEPLSFPDAQEVCDGVDNDCDGLLDGDDPTVDPDTATIHWRDEDLDGYGDPFAEVLSCGPYEGVSDNDQDCDDGDAAINPETVWYADFDGDGYGQTQYITQSCEQPDGYGPGSEDCDDDDASVSPGAEETCDGVDNNCDGEVDEVSAVDAVDWLVDADGDGYGVDGTEARSCEEPEGYAAEGGDCDDTVVTVNPGASETCDLQDNDCDGVVDYAYAVPGDYATLQEALDGLPSGEGACVSGGTYYETLDWTRDVTLRGWLDEEVIIDGGYTSSVVSVVGTSDAVLGEVTLQGGQAEHGAGVSVDAGTFLLENSVITGLRCIDGYSCDGPAVYVVDDGDVTLQGVSVEGVDLEHDRALYGMFHCDQAGEILLRDTVLQDNLLETTGTYDAVWQGYQINACTVEMEDFTASGNLVVTGGSAYGWSARGLDGVVNADGWRVSENLIQAEGALHAQLLHSSNYTQFTGTHVALVDNELDVDGSTYGWILRASGLDSTRGNSNFVINNIIVAGNAVSNTNTSAYLYGGVYIYGSRVSVTNGDFVGNSASSYKYAYTPFFFSSTAARLTVRNLNVVDNSFEGTAITRADLFYSSSSSSDAEFDYINVLDNVGGESTLYRSGEWTPAITSYSLDPSYTDVSGDAVDWDLRISAASPLVDAGDPSILDADGSRSDMGAFGGEEGGSW